MQIEHITTELWPEFRDRIFGSAHWNWLDGIPPDMMKTLKQVDNTQLLNLLKQGLNQKDYLVTFIIRELGIAKFVPRLQREIRTAKDKYLLELAITLNKLDPEKAEFYALDTIIALQDGTLQTRIAAAISLKDFPAELVEESLLKAITNDPDHLVRYHAAQSILQVEFIDSDSAENYEEIFKHVISDDPHDHKLALKELKALKKRQPNL